MSEKHLLRGRKTARRISGGIMTKGRLVSGEGGEGVEREGGRRNVQNEGGEEVLRGEVAGWGG